MEMKENKKFFHGTYSNLTPHLFQRKILKYFNDFHNRNFSVLWLKLTQTMEMKENQIFFHETHSNLTLLFIGQKILKYVNGFCSCHLLISLQKWTQRKRKEDMCPQHHDEDIILSRYFTFFLSQHFLFCYSYAQRNITSVIYIVYFEFLLYNVLHIVGNMYWWTFFRELFLLLFPKKI